MATVDNLKNNYKRIEKTMLLVVLMAGFLFPFFSSSQDNSLLPESIINEIKEWTGKILAAIKKELPDIWAEFWKDLNELWVKHFVPTWQSFYGWLERNVLGKMDKELKERKYTFAGEFERKIKELKEEIPKISQLVWDKIKELIKK